MQHMSAIGAITLFVSDVARSKQWYLTTFERPLVFEDEVSAVIGFEHTIINLLQRSEAPDLVAPAVPAGPGAGPSMQFTIWVDDCEAAVTELRARGAVFVNGPIDRPWGMRTALVADPDGHLWELAQSLG